MTTEQDASSLGAGDADEHVVEASARLGFAARAVLYAIFGLLAGQLALGGSGAEASQQGAMAEIASRPFGAVLLGALAVGLAGYALYRAVQAVKGKGDDGVFRRRVVPAVRAIVNAGLSFLAVQELIGAGGGTTEPGVTAAVLGLPGGAWLVGVVGAAVVGVGVKQLVSAWTGDVNELRASDQLPSRARRTARSVGSVTSAAGPCSSSSAAS